MQVFSIYHKYHTLSTSFTRQSACTLSAEQYQLTFTSVNYIKKTQVSVWCTHSFTPRIRHVAAAVRNCYCLLPHAAVTDYPHVSLHHPSFLSCRFLINHTWLHFLHCASCTFHISVISVWCFLFLIPQWGLLRSPSTTWISLCSRACSHCEMTCWCERFVLL